MEQRTDEWFQARLGKVTASNLDKVMAKGKDGGSSAIRETYLAEVLAERFGAEHTEIFKTKAIQAGIDNEPLARMAYEFATGNLVEEVGLIDHPEIYGFAASPDGLIGIDGNQEIKCPDTKKHLKTIWTGAIDREYILQMHGQMMCARRKWTDFVSFDPRLPEPANLFIKRIDFDPILGAQILTEVRKFLAEVDTMADALIAKFPSMAQIYAPWKQQTVLTPVKPQRSLF